MCLLQRAMLVIAFFCACAPSNGGEVVRRSNPTVYNVLFGMGVTLMSGSVSDLAVTMAVPASNQYQDVVPRGRSDGNTESCPETGDPLLHVVFKTDGAKKKEYLATHRYEITVYDIDTDFDAIEVRPYDTRSSLYRLYTRPRGKYVVPNHPRIARIVKELGETTDVVDFARRAYDYVAKHFTYMDDTLKPLDDIFTSGHGSCANLSSVYISILRAKGIPARHVIGHQPKPDGRHVFSEFYLEGHGWVPVDVTYRQSKPNVDYFGKIRASDRMIVVSRDVLLTIPALKQPKTVVGMQNPRYWYWGKRCEFSHRNIFEYAKK